MRFFLFLLFCSMSCYAKQTICLNMIVKDESEVIKRCLDSVIDLIDYWVIVDTGSTDDTKEIIQEHLKNVPGELHESPWVDFGHNRTEALELAKGKADYLLFMDADDVLEFPGERTFGTLTKDLYNFWRGTSDFTYLKPQLAKADHPWKWIGVTHEYIDSDEPYETDNLENVRYITLPGGAASKHPLAKFFRNIILLEKALQTDQTNTRHVFYLAESYRDARQYGKALMWFQTRIEMEGWDEEVFWSHLQIGHLLKKIGIANNVVLEAYKNAYRFRPHRSEPVYYIAEIYLEERRYHEAYSLIKEHIYRKKPQRDSLFNMDWIDDYGLKFQLSLCAYYVGFNEESLDLCNELMLKNSVPEFWRDHVHRNREFAIAKLREKFTVE